MAPPTIQRQARPKFRRHFQHAATATQLRLKVVWAPARLLSVLLCMACGGLLYWFGTDDRFFVETVRVEGQTTIPADELVQAATVAHWNIFFLRQNEVEARLLTIEGLKTATATLEWPNTVRLQVTERQPLFVWQSTKQTVWVDESGRVFAPRARQAGASPCGCPTVRDLDNQARTQLDMPLVLAIQTVLTALPQVKQFDYGSLKGLSFQSEQGWRVLFGQPNQLNAKLTLLNTLTAQLATQKITPEYIDVRLPERAFYKPK